VGGTSSASYLESMSDSNTTGLFKEKDTATDPTVTLYVPRKLTDVSAISRSWYH
jgi:hypothetical protein